MSLSQIRIALLTACIVSIPGTLTSQTNGLSPKLQRAAEAVRIATSVGVSVARFSELVSEFALELSLAGSDTPAPARDYLQTALEHYRLSVSAWRLKISGTKFVSRNQIPQLASYGLRTYLGQYSVDDVLQAAWAAGNSNVQSGMNVLTQLVPPPVAPSRPQTTVAAAAGCVISTGAGTSYSETRANCDSVKVDYPEGDDIRIERRSDGIVTVSIHRGAGASARTWEVVWQDQTFTIHESPRPSAIERPCCAK